MLYSYYTALYCIARYMLYSYYTTLYGVVRFMLYSYYTTLYFIVRYMWVCHSTVAKRLYTVDSTSRMVIVIYIMATLSHISRFFENDYWPVSITSYQSLPVNMTDLQSVNMSSQQADNTVA